MIMANRCNSNFGTALKATFAENSFSRLTNFKFLCQLNVSPRFTAARGGSLVEAPPTVLWVFEDVKQVHASFLLVGVGDFCGRADILEVWMLDDR